MKKLSKTLSKEYSPIKIFLEDLQKIEEILKGLSPENFEIATNDYKFNNLKDLIKWWHHNQNKKIDSLEISIHTPYYITIKLKAYSTSLYCGSDDTLASGAFYKIDSVLTSTTRKLSFAYSYYFILLWCLILGFLNLNLLPYDLFHWGSIENILLIVSFVIWYLWVGYTRLYNNSRINLTKRCGIRCWLEKHKDKILVGLVVGLFLAVIGGLVDIIIK